MGFVARKSFKVMPGVRMTVSKSGISASVGVPGARISKSSSGRTTRTIGIPGTGVRYTTSSTSERSRTARTSIASAPPPQAVKPGMTAPKWEKALYKAIFQQRFGELPGIAQTYPEAAPLAATLDGLAAMSSGDSARALEVCRWAWSNAGAVENHPFVRKYLGGNLITINVAEGLAATLPVSRDALGLALAEMEQRAGNTDAAIMLVEQLEPSAIAAVALCELYLESGRYDEIVTLTNELRNDDDPTALLVAFRASALRELGHYTAAREAFKEALKSKSRDSGIRHFALVERAKTYLAENKRSMARKDLERVLGENAAYAGVRELLESATETK